MEQRDEGSAPRTNTNPLAQAQAWPLVDPVLGLRVWGSSICHRFPTSFGSLTIGSAESCDITLASADVSQHHATVEHRGDHLLLIDHGKNHTWRGGLPAQITHLVPGTDIELGGVKLVAYSSRTEQLRFGFQRYLGYSETAERDVDDALSAAMKRSHMALLAPPNGGGAALARYIHESGPGRTWPLVVVGERIVADRTRQQTLLASAAFGTLVIRAEHLPRDLSFLRTELEHGRAQIRLVLLAAPDASLDALVGHKLVQQLAIVEMPPLASRVGDLGRIVKETVAHHAAIAGAPSQPLEPTDFGKLEIVGKKTSHDELDETARRIVWVRLFGVNGAARRLGVEASTLSRFLRRRGFNVKQGASLKATR